MAVEFDGEEAERERRRRSVGFADVSHLGKIEIQAAAGDLAAIAAAGGAATLELGRATRTPGAWWCPYTPERAIVSASRRHGLVARDARGGAAAPAATQRARRDLVPSAR